MYCCCTTLQKKSVAIIITFPNKLHFLLYRLIKHPVYPHNQSAYNPKYYSMCSNVLFHLHRPEVSCAIHQQHRPQGFAKGHSKCQSSAVSDWPRRYAPYSIVTWIKIKAIGAHKSGGMNFVEFHAAWARSSDAHGELSQKQQINFPKVVQQQYSTINVIIVGTDNKKPKRRDREVRWQSTMRDEGRCHHATVYYWFKYMLLQFPDKKLC